MKEHIGALFLALPASSLAHDVVSAYPIAQFYEDEMRAVVMGRWEQVSGQRDYFIYPNEHSFKVSCKFVEKKCIEVIASIYTPSEMPAFKESTLYPSFREYEIKTFNPALVVAEISGRAAVIQLYLNFSQSEFCVTETQIIQDKDGSIPAPKKMCLKKPL